jgi:DUF4097 and DUF4098 domain-containing protein YvlB
MVRGITAPIDVDNDDGGIELDDVAGTIEVSTSNGSIVGRLLASPIAAATTENGRIELSFVSPPRSVTGRTDNGSITVTVPDADVLYRVELSTDNGSTDNAVRTDPNSDRVIELRTNNGSARVRSSG